jgi:hypothetical protein
MKVNSQGLAPLNIKAKTNSVVNKAKRLILSNKHFLTIVKQLDYSNKNRIF